MKKDDTHFSTRRVEEALRTGDAIQRARTASSAGRAAVDQSRDRLDAVIQDKYQL